MENKHEQFVSVAYKKLKQMVYYEKNSLKLRSRIAAFECAPDFQQRLKSVAKVCQNDKPHTSKIFKTWIDKIGFDLMPKGAIGPSKSNELNGSFLTNVTSSPIHEINKVNYIFDGPIELHLLSVMWLMGIGWKYDEMLSDHCTGSRLHEFVGRDSDQSGQLFKKYHELYAKWRDEGIQKALKIITEDHKSVCLIGLDVQEYYYRIQINWKELRADGASGSSFNEKCGIKLLPCIETICKDYRSKLDSMLGITHPTLLDEATCLPIGLSASPLIANWYLKKLDDLIISNLRPAYYGRYVDDIFMVVTMHKSPPEENSINSIMKKLLIDNNILNWDEENKRYEILCRPGLYLQQSKCILQYFDANYSTAGLDKFQKQIQENASDFALLPLDGDENPVEQVAYDLLYDGSANKFRSVKAVAENRWELSTHLVKQTQLYLMTKSAIDKLMRSELIKFFKGRNSIDFFDMWESVLSFFVVAGDRKGRNQFVQYIKYEIDKIKFSNSTLTARLKKFLFEHLELCLAMSMSLISVIDEETDSTIFELRQSNMIRHHLVSIPLLNYTNYKGDLTRPTSAFGLHIDDHIVKYTPRFVHIDECMSFIDSGCAHVHKDNSVIRAQQLYKQFHQNVHSGIKFVNEEI
ncbi:MAG: hypothetical protein R3B84_01700 [Zavarzinella sp.]